MTILTNDDFIFEYNSSGNLQYIIDQKAIVGYVVKEAPTKEEVQKIITSISMNRKSVTKIPKWLNKLNDTLLGDLSSKKTSKLLMLIYFVFFSINIINYFNFRNYLKFQMTLDFFSKFNSNQVLIGIILFFVGLIFLHEGFHIFISLLQGVKVSKLGFKLKYGFIPMLYVRIFPTSYNKKKMNIAFAGLVADQFLLLLFSVFFWVTKSEVFYVALILQITLSVFNYNILFPSDFMQSILSRIDYLEFRNDSFKYLGNILKGSKVDFKFVNILKLIYSVSFFIMLLILFLNVFFLMINLK